MRPDPATPGSPPALRTGRETSLDGPTPSVGEGGRGGGVSPSRREPRSSGGARGRPLPFHRLLGHLVLRIRGDGGGRARSAAPPSALRTSHPQRPSS